MNNWIDKFKEEFSIHFKSSGELGFAIDFIKEVESDAYKEGMDNQEEINKIVKSAAETPPVIEGSEQFLKNQAYEKAAKVAEENGNVIGKMIAQSIRSLKDE